MRSKPWRMGPDLSMKPRADRRRVQFHVRIRHRATRATVKIVNISTSGFRLAEVHFLRTGDTFMITLPTLAPQPAKVVWAEGPILGCALEVPLHPTVLQHILQGLGQTQTEKL
jgi:hypothetical protein